ncbi:MAG: ShlB/FhaC/HecB family hemolysin secretion/activation protein [Leptolyngbyaceae cyanobacterium MO_188.B28]|nr:ShlB/FhaC/HecB family hemolysin secretion/activation protein [Leptolyngbyaceae cyanobacterium MO_188.B28]
MRRIEVVGGTVFGPEDLNPIVQPLEGREVTLQQLTNAANAITRLYLRDGYVTSRAVLGEQEIVDGVVQIQVIEGSVQEIQIDGNQRFNAGYIRSRLQLGTDPLKVGQLEEQLRLLQADPLIEEIRGRLQPGEGVGETVLVVEVEEANPFQFGFNFDNYSPPSVGSERTGVSVGYLNLTGNGDSLSGSYNRSTTGNSNVWDVSYRIPVNPMNGSVQLRAVFDDFEASSGLVEGDSQRYEVSYRQPLIRSTREELALSFGFSYRDGQTFLGDRPFGFGIGPDPDTGVSRTSVIRVGQDYIRRDTQGAWALRSQFNIGVGLFDATDNASPIPDSEFLSWLGQIQRVQRLGKNNLLIMQTDVQLANDGLLSSEQFVIGGGQSLRGYRQNARAGDNGFRFSIEDRITLVQDQPAAKLLQLAPFVDMGAIWNDSDNPNNPFLPDQQFLAGAGVGILWEPVDALNIRLDYGIPLVDISDEGDNLQEDGVYFSLRYQF